MQRPDIIHQIHSLAKDHGCVLKQTITEAKIQLEELTAKLKDDPFHRVYILGCGTSYCAAQVCKQVFEKIVKIPTEGAQAFSFTAYQNPDLLDEKTLVVGFSTSGETEAVHDAFLKSKKRGAWTVAVTAVKESRVAKVADQIILTGATDEVHMPRTKGQSQGLFILYLLAIYLAKKYDRFSNGEMERLLSQLDMAVDAIVKVIDEKEENIKQLANIYRGCTNVHVLGSGANFGTAQTGALMVTEMVKIHSLGDGIENFMHGRFRDVDQINPLVILAPKGSSSSRVLDFLTVTSHVRAQTIVLTDNASEAIKKMATHIIVLSEGIEEVIAPIVYITPLHIFAYYLATAKGIDANKKRYPDIIPSKLRYEKK